MFIFDGHSDILTDITSRRLNGERNIFNNRHSARLKSGGVNALISVVWIDPPNDTDPPARQLQIFQQGFGDLYPLENVAFAVKNRRELRDAVEQGKTAMVLGMEGLSGLKDDPEGIYMLYQLGVRHASLTWNEGNAFATGVRAERPDKGLTAAGKKLVRLIEELGILLDVSHADEKTFWDIMDMVGGPVMASHSNAYALCPSSRNLKDDQIKAIASSGGTIGINSYPEFIDAEKPTVVRLLEHVDYLVDKAGIDHVAFGFDFTDFLEAESVASFQTTDTTYTPGIKGAEDIPNLVEGLKARGYSAQDIEKICFLNLERLFERVVG